MIERSVRVAPRRQRCIICPRWFIPRYRRVGGVSQVQRTCGQFCRSRLIAKQRKWKGAA